VDCSNQDKSTFQKIVNKLSPGGIIFVEWCWRPTSWCSKLKKFFGDKNNHMTEIVSTYFEFQITNKYHTGHDCHKRLMKIFVKQA
jgi:hypothetical protein